MKKLSEQQIIALHDLCIEKFGGLNGIRDENLFYSTCTSPYQTFDGKDLHPDIYDKALRYLSGFATNQVSIDGNKRIAAMTMLVFLAINGVSLSLTNNELVELTYNVANKRIRLADAKKLLIERTIK